jgi:hypothetical protein
MNKVAVIVLVALLVLAVTLAVLLVSSTSWAAVQQWLTAQPPPCACLGQ